MRGLTNIFGAGAIVMGLAAGGLPAAAQSYGYTIDGQPADADTAQYMANNGLPPGGYWLDARGYRGVMGDQQPLGNIYAGTYISRYGGSEQGSNGWSHYDNMTGFSVGGDSDGCCYAGDWSNC